MKALNALDSLLKLALVHSIQDDFGWKDTVKWTSTATDSGTSLATDAAGGVMALVPSDGSVADNDEIYVQSSKETFKIADGKPISIGGYIQFTEANTDDANVFVGILDAPIADTLVDNGAGMKTSFSGAAFYKVDGGTRWQVIYSDGATQTIADLTATNTLNKVAQSAGGASYQLLEIDILPKTSTKVDIVFKIDGKVVYKMIDKTYASATEMAVAVGAKNGGANNESIKVDYLWAAQKR